ncbi:formyltetrahydrofolate deformylase [Spirochaetia bacterium]|nr:formyltetrahydrofolate deformylase [Spirochaetia bacterium]GHU35900.1 formyltetrahydrofolate deformylase [Spirochaetia bacterium]
MKPQNTAVLLMLCQDKNGIIANVTALLARLGANIVYLDQHTDHEFEMFFMRLEWDLEHFSVNLEDFRTIFTHESARHFDMTWELHQSAERQSMCIFVSKYAHCFLDILSRWRTGSLHVDIPVIISNHEDLRSDAERFNIPFIYLPVNAENREDQALEQLRMLQEHRIDFIVLARYMQIIPPALIQAYSSRIINIHHSFLPGFPGAKPYHQAYARGVKIIGATAHYVTEELDTGPIIEQDVERISHKFSIDDLISTGQDIERRVLARAVRAHVEHRILTYKNRTVIFS